MGNVIDYLIQYGDQAFAERAFCDVDVLILAQLSYFDFGSAVPTIAQHKKSVTLEEIDRTADLSAVFADKWYGENNRKLWNALLAGRRFRTMRCNYYRERMEEEQEAQFGAVTFFPEGCEPVVAFRGTDDSVVGWKEDFNMSFLSPVPSQKDAVRYIDTTVQRSEGKLILGGHSKGGNLAVYASVFARPSVKKRIITVYNNDGPGFDSDFVKHPDYLAILPKIKSIVPYGSVVGMLLNHDGDYEVVKSSQSGLMQHDSMSWQVIGPDFETEQELSPKSKRLNAALSAWIDGLTREQRAEFVDTLFSLVTASGAKNLSEISTARFKNINAVLKSFRELDKSERAMILKIFASLTGEIGKVI